MKQINPVPMWINGKNVNAEFINVISVNDNLQNSATFYYQLLSVTNDVLVTGNLTMSGDEYLNWNGTNQAAFVWSAKQLNLTLI